MPLPIDPQWKNDYAASVRRLIRDGVDVPLARLFVHVTRPPEAGVKGVAKARSASEKFFYQRLQTLAATKDMFQINSNLPIPFNERSEMEVDFLCAEKNLVIELDGDQHLNDKDAPAKALLAHIITEQTSVPQKWIAQTLHVGSAPYVSKLAKKMKLAMAKSKEWRTVKQKVIRFITCPLSC